MKRLVTFGWDLSRHRVIRFVAVGGLNTLFGYAIYLAGLSCELRPVLALALATMVGAMFNYFTTARFVFGHRALNRLPVFLAAYGVVYIVNALTIQLLFRAGLSPALAQAVLVPAIAALSFSIFQLYVFRPSGGQ